MDRDLKKGVLVHRIGLLEATIKEQALIISGLRKDLALAGEKVSQKGKSEKKVEDNI